MSCRRIFAVAWLAAAAGCLSFGYRGEVGEDFAEIADEIALRETIASGEDATIRYLFRTAAAEKDSAEWQNRRSPWNFCEVKLAQGRLEVAVNGRVVHSADRYDAKTQWPGFTGREQYREIRRIRPAAPAVACPEGFLPLFDGGEQTLTNWLGVTNSERFDNPAVRDAATPEKRAAMQNLADRLMREHWRVTDGSLVFDGGKGGYSLATRRQFEDFELWADWRLLTVTGDSGLCLRGSPQVQIWDAHNHRRIGSGGLYGNDTAKTGNPSQPLTVADNRIGDWNRFHIVMRGDRVTVWLNGELVVDDVRFENYWDRRRPVFAKERLELQCLGDPIEWRNIFIRDLAAPTVSADRVGVCSWSWRRDHRGVAAEMEKCGIRGICLALGPFVGEDAFRGTAGSGDWEFAKKQVASGRWQLMSTMVAAVGADRSSSGTLRRDGGIVSDAAWDENRRIVERGARLTRELGCRWMSLRTGFLDVNDPAAFAKCLERVAWMRDCAAKSGVSLMLEAGAVPAEDLLKLLDRVPDVYVDFDPADAVLCGQGDPAAAVKLLLPHVRQIRARDAVGAAKSGDRGEEVLWGDGVANGKNFLKLMEELGYSGNYVIARDGGDNRAYDINLAFERLTK